MYLIYIDKYKLNYNETICLRIKKMTNNHFVSLFFSMPQMYVDDDVDCKFNQLYQIEIHILRSIAVSYFFD